MTKQTTIVVIGALRVKIQFLTLWLISFEQVIDADSSSLSGDVEGGSCEGQEERRLGQVSTREVPYSRVSLTHFRLNKLPYTIYWKSPILILDMSNYMI